MLDVCNNTFCCLFLPLNSILDGALVTASTLAHRYLTSRRLPDSAIDLVDEAAAAVRVTRDSQPEAVDRLERKKLQLEVEAHALGKEKVCTALVIFKV